MIPWLDPALYRDIVRRALDEDIGDGDITTDAIVGDALRAKGVFLVKADCVLAGLDVAFETFRQVAADRRAAKSPSTHDTGTARHVPLATKSRRSPGPPPRC